jgi:hypothetical protein
MFNYLTAVWSGVETCLIWRHNRHFSQWLFYARYKFALSNCVYRYGVAHGQLLAADRNPSHVCVFSARVATPPYCLNRGILCAMTQRVANHAAFLFHDVNNFGYPCTFLVSNLCLKFKK